MPASGIRVPRIYRELLTKRVMVQERFDGPNVTRTRSGSTSSASTARLLADQLVHTVAMHMFSHGHYHSDPHPGNVLMLADGSLGLIDFGSTGRLDPRQRTALLEMTAAVMRRRQQLAARRDRTGRARRAERA